MSSKQHPARVSDAVCRGELARSTTLAVLVLASCSVYDPGLLGSAVLHGSAGTSTGGVSGNRGSGPGNVPMAGNATGASPASAGSGGSDSAGDIAHGGAAGTDGGSASAADAGAADGGAATQPTPRELAAGKSAKASSSQAANGAVQGNDGKPSTRWCAGDASFPQWWRVDLGAPHELHSFVVSFERSEQEYFYELETSTDDAVYVLRSKLSGTGARQSALFPPGVSARYVRITVTNAQPLIDANGTHATWASFFEFSLLGI